MAIRPKASLGQNLIEHTKCSSFPSSKYCLKAFDGDAFMRSVEIIM